MKTKNILKNIIISLIIGIALGAISEFALILNISWLIRITQSFCFWGIIMCISAYLSRNYILSLINSILIMSSMNSIYYIIRLIKSGYTNTGNWEMYTLTGIAGSIYFATLVYLIKEKIHHNKSNNFIQKYSLIFMTICGIILSIYGFYKPISIIRHNLIYNLDIGVIIGFIIGIIIGNIKVYKKIKK